MNKPVDTATLKALDRAHHLHPFTDLSGYARDGGRIISRAEHIYIYDSDGTLFGRYCAGATTASGSAHSAATAPSSLHRHRR